MITGAIIFLIGSLTGYSIPFWKRPFKPNPNKLDKAIKGLFNKQAKIVELVNPLDKIDLS